MSNHFSVELGCALTSDVLAQAESRAKQKRRMKKKKKRQARIALFEKFFAKKKSMITTEHNAQGLPVCEFQVC
jgi:hypothetical protein